MLGQKPPIMTLNSKNEIEFFKEYYLTKDEYKKDKMFMIIYDFYKNMFFKELKRSYTIGKIMEEYETNFKIEFVKALKNFNQDKGFRFSTYLFTKIKAAIQRTNKEESSFSVKEYKLNILNIYKSKIINEIQKMNNIQKDECDDIINCDDFSITNFKGINLKQVYDEMYAEYKLPKVKYETLIEDLPFIFSQKISNTGETGQDIMDIHAMNSENGNFNEIGTEHLNIYFLVKKIYEKKNTTQSLIRLDLTKMGFNLECTKEELSSFYNNISNGGSYVIDYLENNISHPEDKLWQIKNRLQLV